MKKTKRILSVGETIIRPNAPPDEQTDFISMDELLKPPYPRLTDHTYTHLYMPFVLCRALDALPIMQELWRVSQKDALLEVTVPCGSADNAWEDPSFVRPYFNNSFLYFAQPMQGTLTGTYTADWQARAVYMRIPDGLLQQIPEDSRYVAAVTKRNVCVELCCVLQAYKPARKRGDKEAMRMPKLLVQPFSARVE